MSQASEGIDGSLNKQRREFTGVRAALVVAAVCMTFIAACAKETPEGLIRAAERHLAEHEYRTAQIELRNAIQLAPNSGAGHRLLGTALLRGGDPVAAEGALRKALTLSEGTDAVMPTLAQALIRQAQPQRLIDEFENVKLQDPAADASFQTSLGHAWLMRGGVKQAVEAFASALVAVPGHPPARLGQARIAAQGGRIDDASTIADEVLVADPRLVEAHAFKAQLLLSQGRRAEAIESLEKAVAIDGGDVPARVALVSLRIGGREYDRAQVLLDATNRPLAGDPRFVYLRGLLALRKGDLQKASDEVNKILLRAPEHAPTLTLAGEIELRSNSLTRAEGYFRKALRSSPDAPAPRRLLAATYLRQGRPGKAVDAIQPLLQQSEPKDAQMMMLAGEAYLASGDATRAAEFFESSRSGAASEAVARLRLGQIALGRGDLDRGVFELQAASAMDTEHHQADLLLVALHLRRQEPEKALAAAEAFIKKQPSNPFGYALAGAAHLAGKDLTRARQSFHAGLKIQPDYLPALRGLTDVDLAEGRADEAARRYEALVTKKPGDEQILVAFAEQQERMGNAAEAGATLRRALKANPQSPTPYAALVQHHLRQRDPKAALTVAQEAVAANPSQPRLLELLGNTQEATGASDDAIRSFRELARLEPHALAPLLKLASAQTKRRDFSGAARSLRQAQQMAPNNDGIARDLVAVHLAAAKFDEALGVAKALQVRKPEAAVGHALEGEVHASRQKWPEAERAYRNALSAEPQSSAIAISLCRMLSASGKKGESAAFARNWISRNPDDMPMRMYVADVALKAKDNKAAAFQYESVLRQAPENVLALNNLAWTLGELRDPRAVGFAERAVALAPNSAPVLDTLGMLHVEHGDPKKGVEYLERAQSLAPSRKELRLHYAIGLIKVGRMDEGKAVLQELASSQEDFSGKADIPTLLAKL